MGLTMDKLLKKFNDCDKFSLLDNDTNCKITEEEFDNALKKMEETQKKN